MGINHAQRRATASTRVHVQQISAGALGERMRRSHRRRHRSRSADEVEDAFQEAATQAVYGCRAENERGVYTFMWRAMNSILTQEARHSTREVATPNHSGVFEIADARSDPQAALEKQEDQRELLTLFERLAGELGPRQRSILSLHVRGVKRPRVACELGVSERIVKRELERILSRARALLVARCEGGCPTGTQLVWRFAFGLASASEAAQAQLHLIACPSCQVFLGRLGWWREAAAAAVPVPAVHQLDSNLAGQVLHAVAERAGDLKHQVANSTSSLRQHTGDAATQVKQHGQAAYARALDPTPLAGLRPGAAATVVAGCLALGGGGAYCIEKGVNPVQSLAGTTQSQPQQQPPREPARPPPPERVEPAPPIDAPQAPVEAAPTPAPEPPHPSEPPPLEPPTPAPQPTPAPVEFGEPASAPAAPPVQAQASSQPAQPAPAPAGGSDFGP